MKLKIGKKSGLTYFNIQDVRSWGPCYDPSRYVPETFRGTAVDILKNGAVPAQDRLWVVLRTDLISERVMRLFAVWAYRQTLKFLPNQDPRCIEAASVAERFANGQASSEELSAAYLAAHSAAHSAYLAADSAARSASYLAADSAYLAARSARSAHSAAHSAYLAADSARWAVDSAHSAARSASLAYLAADSASLAHSAAHSAQVAKLIEMVIADGLETRRNKDFK